MLSNWRSPPRPDEKSPEQVGRITGGPGKSAEGERVADGPGRAMKRSNVGGAKGPCHLQRANLGEGKDEMTKASIGLQDLRRRIYVKARLNRPGVSGVYMSTSARWKPCVQRMRWPDRTMVRQE